MDVTTTSPQTYNWELLARLALCGQRSTSKLDAYELVRQCVVLLHTYLPHPWGLLIGSEDEHITVWDCWGLDSDEAARLVQQNGSFSDQQGNVYILWADDERAGQLLLPKISDQTSSDEQIYYQAIATQIGLLLQVQRRQQSQDIEADDSEQPDEFHVLNCISRHATSSTDPANMLSQVCRCLDAFFGQDICHIVLYQAEHQQITFAVRAEHGAQTTVSTSELPAPDSPLTQVLHQGEPLFLHHEATLPGPWMGIPLLTSHHQVLGAVTVQRQRPGSFTEREQVFLSTAARQIVLGVQNVQLLLSAEDQMLQLGLLNFVSSVAASTARMEDVYEAVLDTMVQVTHVDQSRLVLFDEERNTGRIVAEYIPTDLPQHITIPFHDNPATEWLEQNFRPLVGYDAQNEPVFVVSHEVFRALDIRSIVLIPLFLNGKMLGTISLDVVGRQDHFSSQQLEFCQTIANHVATLIEKDQLFVQTQSNAVMLEQRVGELSTLLESAGILGSLLQPDEVINSLTDLVSRQLRVASVALWTMSTHNVLVPTALYGIQVENPQTLQLPVGRGLTGTVAETGLPLIVHDINDHTGEHHRGFFGGESNLTSFMGVPIIYQDRVIGVLSVMSAERREFSSDEMMLLVGLAGQAAVALENARLFQERERRIAQLMTINRMSTTVNATFDLDEVLLALHHSISEVLDTTWSFIGLYEEPRLDITDSQVRMRVVRSDGNVALSNRSVLIDGRGLIDYVVLKYEPLLLQDHEELRSHLTDWGAGTADSEIDSAEFSGLDEPFISWLGVPILQGGHVLGIINVQSYRDAAYDEDDQRFLSTIASQAGTAISNAQLFSERERRLRELSVLKDIGSAISSNMDPQVVLENLRYELGQAVDVSTSLFGLYDEKTDTLSAPVCYDRGKPVAFSPMKIASDASSWVIRNLQPLLLHTIEQGRQIGLSDFDEVEQDEAQPASEQAPDTALPVAQSFLVVPIMSGDTVLGVINLRSYSSYAFDQDDLRFVFTVANQAAVTIANIYLFIERGRRIEELATFNEVSRALSATTSFEDLPELIYRQTSRLLDTSNFSMALLREGYVDFPIFYENGTAHQIEATVAENGLRYGDYLFPSALSTRYQGEALAVLIQQVTVQREPLLVQGIDTPEGEWIIDAEQLAQRNNDQDRPHLWLGAPMIVADKVVGVIAVQSYEQYTYTPDSARLLSTIASSAAIVLENARLFNELSTLAADLERRVAERTTELADANMELLAEKERLETVHVITLELTASLDLDEIISRALEMVSTNLNVARGSIMLRDPQSGSLVCRALLQDQGIVRSANLPISFDNGEGLAQWVMENQNAVCIPDVRFDSRWVIESGRADEARSVVCVPLITSDTTLGVLILSSPKINYFTEAQQRLLGTIANEVAIAINNAQLYSYITEMASRLAELLEQQKEETSKSRSIFQSMTEGVLVLDTDRRIAVLNLAAEHMLGVTASDLIDQPLTLLQTYGYTNEQRDRAFTIHEALDGGLKTAKERQGIYSTSFELHHPNQTIAVNLSPVTAFDGGIYGDVAVLRDITPEIESDRAKREFFSKVSHELRTPLTSIKGYAQVLQISTKEKLDDQEMNLISVVRKNADQLDYLINDILDISKFEAGKIKLNLSQVHVPEIVDEVVQSLHLEADKKTMQVQVDMQDDLPMVTADKKRLTQVVTNLFSNAVKYTYEGGRIRVRVFLTPSNLMQVEVEDTGVGMSPAQLQKLFRPFYRADNPLSEKSGGTGLGLSIAKSLVEQHNGEMWVSSELNKGSTFFFVLPLEQPGVNGATAMDEVNE